MRLALIADIGGTHVRFALWRDGRPQALRVLATGDYPGPEEAIRAYLAELGLPLDALETACLACAGPVHGDRFRLTNNPWQFGRLALTHALGLRQLLVINDFAAMALGMTALADHERLTIRPGLAATGCPRLVLGPGTGLGVSALLPDGAGGWRVLPGEGGHVDLPLGSAREVALWQVMQRELGHVSAESVLSGGGLLRLYRASCVLDGRAPQFDSAAAVSAAALAGEAGAAAVLEQFCCWLGRVAGNHALTLGARGGVYLAGGMLPHFADFLQGSGFARCFVDKGVMSDYLEDIPVWLATAEQPGLLGAGLALQAWLERSPA
ncbi:glucokinase [Azotobacter chroococcum]|jgi:glucokinase|uniref:Glucokinase n=1 Tax=Azotobacter chroococcum TaxID=353 RepID=A0A4R1PTP7_9GAMM|nr:glucokinase [Azotobacter chroococcum]TBV98975.1 glucokinase [Azotobacter chroococcum]TCL29411.1 glucokinase [Azotobacter chroococcum]